jgi:peptidoglycan/LPS O-acetylase OafA/YrhL
MTSDSDRAHAGTSTKAARLLVLDGWRAVSILFVLATHMLPLGPKSWSLNESSGLAGMALFFTLSGFLITTNLLRHPSVLNFVIRRGCRILPLAYVATIVYLLIQQKGAPFYVAHFLFLVNYDHAHMTPATGHFWSLCVEVHFYVFVALLVLAIGRKGLPALPLVALAVTALRVSSGVYANIMTHLRVDEILSGATLGLVWADKLGTLGRRMGAVLRAVPVWVWVVLLAVASHPASGGLQYARPYLATALVGHTLLNDRRSWRALRNRPMQYVAEISYALYVIHPLTMYGWLGSGGRLVKYTKRILSFGLTFGLAHLSTFHMERHVIAFGKWLTHRLEHRTGPASRSIGVRPELNETSK